MIDRTEPRYSSLFWPLERGASITANEIRELFEKDVATHSPEELVLKYQGVSRGIISNVGYQLQVLSVEIEARLLELGYRRPPPQQWEPYRPAPQAEILTEAQAKFAEQERLGRPLFLGASRPEDWDPRLPRPSLQEIQVVLGDIFNRRFLFQIRLCYQPSAHVVVTDWHASVIMINPGGVLPCEWYGEGQFVGGLHPKSAIDVKLIPKDFQLALLRARKDKDLELLSPELVPAFEEANDYLRVVERRYSSAPDGTKLMIR